MACPVGTRASLHGQRYSEDPLAMFITFVDETQKVLLLIALH